MNKKILFSLVILPMLAFSGCKYDNFNWDTSSAEPSSSEAPSSSSESSSSEPEDYSRYMVDAELFTRNIQHEGQFALDTSFTMNTVFKTGDGYDKHGTIPIGSVINLTIKGDHGKFFLRTRSYDVVEANQTNYLFYDPATYIPEYDVLTETKYSYNEETTSWDKTVNHGVKYLEDLALIGFVFDKMIYDRFTFDKNTLSYTCPFLSYDADAGVFLKNVTLHFEDEQLIFYEYTFSVKKTENTDEQDYGTFTTDIVDIGSTTVELPETN